MLRCEGPSESTHVITSMMTTMISELVESQLERSVYHRLA